MSIGGRHVCWWQIFLFVVSLVVKRQNLNILTMRLLLLHCLELQSL